MDIDDRILGDLISALGLATDEDSENALLARLKRFQLGWSVEHEFAALSLWFGRCTLIHFLDREKQLPESSLPTYRVPDLLGVYSAGGREVPALIEVKSSYRLYLGTQYPGNDPESRRNRLTFARDYFTGLANYGRLVGLPVLVAWKVRQSGDWFLFPLETMTLRRTAYSISTPEATRNTLMGALLGDVFVGLRVGTRYTLGVRKIGPEREGGEFLGIITQDRLTSATGQQYSGDAPLWPLMAGVDIDETVERGDEFISTFIVPEGYGKWAHRLLPLAVQGTANDERMDWLSIMRSEHFAHPFSEFENAFDEWISQGFADFVGRIVPQNAPLFLDGVDLGRPTPERRHQRR